MENRRQHYRHEFAPTRPMAVRLQCAEAERTIVGDVINLSIGGMCVYASALQKENAEKWNVVLALKKDAPPVTIPAERIHAGHGDRAKCGFRFEISDDLEAMDERDKTIWKFLLDEQRRRRRST